jgi:hypothetical protein
MALSLSSDRATVQGPLIGCADKSTICMLHLLMTAQVRVNRVKPGGERHGKPDEAARNRQRLRPFLDGPHSI